MCNCGGNVVNYTHLNIYTLMAKYKAKKDVVLIKDGVTYNLKKSSQEELAYLYEDLGLTKLVEKLSTIKTEDEPKKESKRSSKNKSSDSKE
jgi:sulfur transfer complex TusBCD TusB component (DsrH family)